MGRSFRLDGVSMKRSFEYTSSGYFRLEYTRSVFKFPRSLIRIGCRFSSCSYLPYYPSHHINRIAVGIIILVMGS